MKKTLFLHGLVPLIAFCLSFCTSPVLAEERDETLFLLEGGAESVTASRVPKPLSQSAENITIVTAEEIESLNAHTLVDVLATLPGVQLDALRTPGSSPALLSLQGSGFSHVLVMLDGVPVNNLADNFSDIGLIPAHIIERIEIVKGAASSSWGQALGGVINIITKSSESSDSSFTGGVSASYGEQGTGDTRGEVGGGFNRFGYYLSTGYLASDGLMGKNKTRLSNAYAKLSYSLPTQGEVVATFAELRGKRRDFYFPAGNMQENITPRMLLATLTLRQPVTERLELELGSRYANKEYDLKIQATQDDTDYMGIASDESTLGLSARAVWRGMTNQLAAGVEYEDVDLRQNDSLTKFDTLNRRTDRWGFYLNNTLTLGPVAVSPGVRYDLTGRGGEQFSPSLGVTWQVTDNSLLRAYTARGYSLSPFLSDLNTERVWTSQVGVESGAIANLWLKATLFRNDTWDILVRDSQTDYHHERQVKQGGEVELRTTPWHHTSLSAGYTYLDARRRSDDSVVRDIPSQTVQTGIRYDDQEYIKTLLTGRYIWWNASQIHHGRYSAMIWDLHLTATPFGRASNGAELFFSIRNLFNGSQYLDEVYSNTGRWAEMGVRVRF
jgi:vitamin B12 transporter